MYFRDFLLRDNDSEYDLFYDTPLLNKYLGRTFGPQGPWFNAPDKDSEHFESYITSQIVLYIKQL